MKTQRRDKEPAIVRVEGRQDVKPQATGFMPEQQVNHPALKTKHRDRAGQEDHCGIRSRLAAQVAGYAF
jgi:hypothetical protein